MKPEAIFRLGPADMSVLMALASGRTVTAPSAQRVRLEMLELVHDGPNGLRITPMGRKLLSEGRCKPMKQGTEPRTSAVKRDALGRRRQNQRNTGF